MTLIRAAGQSWRAKANRVASRGNGKIVIQPSKYRQLLSRICSWRNGVVPGEEVKKVQCISIKATIQEPFSPYLECVIAVVLWGLRGEGDTIPAPIQFRSRDRSTEIDSLARDTLCWGKSRGQWDPTERPEPSEQSGKPSWRKWCWAET